MSSAWLLPEHIADVLPEQARHIEGMRRSLLDAAGSYGFELVMPPLLEHIESLLSGTGRELNLQTFKLVDQLSGRTLGLRADSTPQVARIDAHLLNRAGVTRLCYCGPVLHTRPAGIHASREPLQFGAEIYGHSGLEADLEIQDLALECLQRAGIGQITLDLGDVRILDGLLEDAGAADLCTDPMLTALAAKDVPGLQESTAHLPPQAGQAVRHLAQLYGGVEVLAEARRTLPKHPRVHAALDDLETLAAHARMAHPEVSIGFDLADIGGFAYYSGPRFAVYARGWSDAIARGGRYDEVGAVFGRNRPAVGFSLDLKDLAALVPTTSTGGAIRATWSQDSGLRHAVRRLRDQGEKVVCVLPGDERLVQEPECDRELVAVGDAWAVRAL